MTLPHPFAKTLSRLEDIERALTKLEKTPGLEGPVGDLRVLIAGLIDAQATDLESAVGASVAKTTASLQKSLRFALASAQFPPNESPVALSARRRA